MIGDEVAAEVEKVVVILTTFGLVASLVGVKEMVNPDMGLMNAVRDDG